jgi:hypothetical protein
MVGRDETRKARRTATLYVVIKTQRNNAVTRSPYTDSPPDGFMNMRFCLPVRLLDESRFDLPARPGSATEISNLAV